MHGEEILERSEISIRHFSVTPKLCTVDDARPCARDLVTLDALIDYAQYHHAAEEKLTSLYAYPRAAGHDQRHQQLISQLTGYATVVLAGDLPDKAEFQRFFDSWLVQHINDEDRKCGGFLNAKGVY